MSKRAVRSKGVRAAWIAEAEGLPVFRVYGDPDDPLRLIVLIADRFSREAPALRDDADACKSKRASWSERLAHLQRILARVPRPHSRSYVGVFVDVDLLHPKRSSGPKLWKDRAFQQQRTEFFDAIHQAFERSPWLVLRPNPSDDVSKQFVKTLDQLPGDSEVCADLTKSLAWLKARRHLDTCDIHDIVKERGVEELEIHVLMRTYESLEPWVQLAGRRLSALRGPQVVNGHIGGFKIIHHEGNASEFGMVIEAHDRCGGPPVIDARALSALEDCGFLQPALVSPGRMGLRMPAKVRSFLRRLQRLTAPELWECVNLTLATQAYKAPDVDFERLPIEEQIDIHHHAVEGRSLHLAQSTGLYYGSDLRSMAFRMSEERDYAGAAHVYRSIVDEFDENDAYAWEYLGYNLARDIDQRKQAGGSAPTSDERKVILHAYEKAVEKDGSNPLYQGRLLGFRAESQEPDIAERFEKLMAYYIAQFRAGSPSQKAAVGYFANAVFDGLKRGGRSAEQKQLQARWHAELAGNRYFEREHDD